MMDDLWKCIEEGNTDNVKVILKSGFDPNNQRIINGERLTPLMFAVQHDAAVAVYLLLRHGAKMQVSGLDSALVTAAKHGCHGAVVQNLLDEGCDPNVRDSTGMPVLVIAAEAGHVNIVELLLCHASCDRNVLSPPPRNVRRLDDFHTGHTALLAAISSGSQGAPIVEALLRRGADPEIAAETKLDGAITPLMLASMFGQVGVAEMLITCGADVHARDGSDQTPLHWAVKGAQLTKHSEIGILDPLLEANSDLNAISNCGGDNITPALRAADIGDYVPLGHAMTKALIEAGCEIHHRDMYGMTLLHRAARYGWLDIAELLLSRGASIEVTDTVGHTPLYSAIDAFHANLQVVRLLLGRNCDVEGNFTYLAQCNIRIPNITLLDLALENGNLHLLPWLIAAGCPLRRCNVAKYEHRVVMNPDAYSWLMTLQENPMSLRDRARICIRRSLPVGCDLGEKVKTLPLATELKEFTLLNNGVNVEGVGLNVV